MTTAEPDAATAKRLATIERKLDELHRREFAMFDGNSTRTQRDRLRTKVNELCAERNEIRGLPMRQRMGDRRI
jgi:hypothetical protein